MNEVEKVARTKDTRRWWRRLRGRGPVALDRTRSDLVVVVAGFDDAEACSTTLARGEDGQPPWRPSEEAVLRHYVTLPTAALDEAESIAAQDSYTLARINTASADTNLTHVRFERVQLLDALHCSQERSRMAGLAQRLGGEATGWDATQPPVAPTSD